MENKVLPIIFAPLIYTLLLPLALFVWILNEFTRCCVRTLLWIKYKGSVRLVEDACDAAWNYKLNGNTRNVLIVGITEQQGNDNKSGLLSPEKCALQFQDQVLQHEEENSWFYRSCCGAKRKRPYRKLEHVMVTRMGYSCWRWDKNFDVRRHFRMVPDPWRLYQERDVLDLLSVLGEDMDETKPQWEWIFIPRYAESEGDQEKSVQIFRYHHCYMDGMSLLLMFSLRLAKGGTTSIPLHPVKAPVYLRLKLCLYLKTFLYGPYHLLRILLSQGTYWLTNGPYGHSKNYVTTPPIPQAIFKSIRSETHASIPNIISKAFITASKRVLGPDRILKSIRMAEMIAILPYRNPNPQNKFAAFSYDVPTVSAEDDEDSCNLGEAMGVLKKDRLSRMIGAEPLLYFHVLTYLGLMPTFIPTLALAGVYNSLILSNVPAFKERISCFGAELLHFSAWPPNSNQTGITMASTSYAGNFQITSVCDSSWLTKTELELIFQELVRVIYSFESNGNLLEVKGSTTNWRVWSKMRTTLSFVHELNQHSKR